MADDGTVGYRFHPTDEELISHYLKNKMLGNLSLVRAIPEVEIYKSEPWDLPQKSELKSDDLVWYFFCGKDYSGKRASRTTKGGFWKATGRDRKIKGKGSNREIGTKKTLVFHEGRVPKGRRTNWVIHEYHSAITVPNQRAYVICKLKKKGGEKTGISSGEGGEPSRSSPSDIGNQSARITTPELEFQAEDNSEPFLDDEAIEFVRSIIQPEEGIFLSDLQYADGFGDLDNNVLQSQLIITDEEQEFVNSMFAEQYESPCEETVYNTLSDDYRPRESLRGVHRKNSSDTDAETTTYAWHNKNPGPSSLIGGIAGSSKACKQMIVEDGCGSRYEPEMLINPYDATQRYKGEGPLECVAVHEQGKRKISSKKKIKMVGESKVIMRKSASEESLDEGNKKESFSFLEITHITHEPNPPSFYIGNIVIGVTLLIFCVGEFMSLRS